MSEKSPQKSVKRNINGLPKPNGRKGKMWMFQVHFNLKNVFIGLFVVFILLSLLGNAAGQNSLYQEKPLSTVITDVKDGKVSAIDVEETKLTVTYKDGVKVTSHKEAQESLVKLLSDAGATTSGVAITIKDMSVGAMWLNILSNVLPLLLTVLFFLFIFRQARGAQDNLFSFGQSKARIWNKDLPKVTFADVAGVDEAKKELEEVVDFLKNSAKYKAMGARTPKGVLLVGPSGVGKTLLARAVAGEANVPFYSMAGSEFMEMLVGVGSARVRDLFLTAKKNAPSIIFIDEVDAIGRQRGHGLMGGHDEREQTLNQILVEMDGFTANENVVVLAATNRPELLDPALVRPGRFDRRVMVDMPDIEGRKAILAIYAKNKPFVKSVKWEAVAKRTVGFSGADLENMLNEAAIGAARESLKEITMENIEEAATKVKLGPQKKRLQS